MNYVKYNTPTNIICLLGFSLVGKDTFGSFFINKGYKRIAFADAAKKEFAQINNIDENILFIQGPLKEKYRPRLIEFAEKERKRDPQIWINKATKPYLDEDGDFIGGQNIIITDVRRSSEIEWIRNIKEKLDEVIFPESKNSYLSISLILVEREGIKDNDVITHGAISLAKRLNIIDYTINNTTLEQLQLEANNIIEKYNIYK